MNFATENLVFDPQIIRRFDVNGPRYTSYPTADRFVEAFDSDAAKLWLGKRTIGGISRPLSLYFHIPFCNTICYYCACNKIITKDHGRSAKYLKYLAKEVALQSQSLDGEHEVIQLHWGGGTPTFLSHDEMRTLMETTRKHFKLLDGGEYSIEVDPRKVDTATVALLGELGFNRMSVGVQDFDERVQVAVNRVQSEEETASVINAARANGFKSVSVDLIYGLPYQTVMGFSRTLERVLAMDPERLSIYNYAHLPGLFKPQRRIAEADLPSADTKLQILALAIKKLTEAGYVFIGMDHFAKPDDELAVAQRQGRLHRNFQGYSTYADSDMLSFGISSIGKVEWEEGWHFVRLLAETEDGDLVPLVDEAGAPVPWNPAPSTAVVRPNESDPFYVLTDEDVEVEPRQRAVPREASLAHARLRAQFIAVSQERDPASVDVTSIEWLDHKARGRGFGAGTLEVKLGREGAVHVPLSPVLLELERSMLSAPDDAISWRMQIVQGTPRPAVVELAGWPHSLEADRFIKVRKQYFEAVRSVPKDLVTQGADPLALKPLVLEYAGEVLRAGSRVDGFAVGDRVMGILSGASYAEKIVTHHRLAVRVPQNLSWHQAAAVPEAFITAHDALSQCALGCGESVLVHAVGSGVGAAAVQVASILGATPILGTAGSADKLAAAKKLGLDVGIDYKNEDFVEATKRATGGRGAAGVGAVRNRQELRSGGSGALALQFPAVGNRGGTVSDPTSDRTTMNVVPSTCRDRSEHFRSSSQHRIEAL